MARRNVLDIGRCKLGQHISAAMRRACPVPGQDWDKFMTVLLPPGKGIAKHQHKRHTILYYPRSCYGLVVEGRKWRLQAGSMHYLPPGTNHAVFAATIPGVERLSVAMLIS